jgi:hypothetical protein
MATLWLQTNDSTIHKPGLHERGGFYLDLHGRGLAGLDGGPLALAPVLIGNSVDGTAILENTTTATVGVDRIYFEGGDIAEFAPVGWPATPTFVLPGDKLSLTVRMTPTGTAGTRRTTIVLITSQGDTVRVPVRGEAGTQTVTVAPTTLFEDVTIPIGQTARRTLMIANTGTLPVRILSTRITGPDSALYLIGTLPRLELEPGQTEYLELTFTPIASGQTTAQLEIVASNGQTYIVILGGSALKAYNDVADPRVIGPISPGDVQRQGTITTGRIDLK